MVKLMIVDDEKLTREGLLNFIPWRDFGIHTVEAAGDAREALAIAIRLRPEIILCDIKLPDMNGIELSAKVRDILPDCKIIFLSAYTDKEYLKSAIHLKAINYLEKPISREELKNAIKGAVQEVTNDNNRLKQKYMMIKRKLVTDLAGSQVASAEIYDQFRALGYDLTVHTKFITALIKLELQEDLTAHIPDDQKTRIIPYVESAFSTELITCIAEFKDSKHILAHFIGSEIDYHSFTVERLLTLKNEIEAELNTKIRIFMGIGIIVKKPAAVLESYHAAVLALQRHFFVGHDKIAFYDDKRENGYMLDDEAVVTQFRECLKEYDKEKVIGFIRNVSDHIKNNTNLLVNHVKNLFFDMLLILDEFYEDINIPSHGKEDKCFLWDAIASFPVLEEIEEYLIHRIEFLFDSLKSVDSIGQSVIAIMNFIQDNFHDESLTINTIAQHMYLTPTYLCMIFKNKTQKTINEYITDIRIEKAKQLLKEEKIKLHEVANRVGYQSPNHFAKTFKKMIGMNPSDFRKRLYI